MSKNELVPEVRLNKNNVPVTKWVKRDAAASTAASMPAPSMGSGNKTASHKAQGPKVKWSRGGKFAVIMERIFPWTNTKREGVFDRLRSAVMDDTVEGLRNMDTSGFGIGIGRGSSQRAPKAEPSIKDSEYAIQPFLNATESLSSKAMDYTLNTLKDSTAGPGLYKMVPSDFDYEGFSRAAGKDTEAEFMNVAALRGSGSDVRTNRESLFRIQELRGANPVFNRIDLFNLSQSEKEQAAAIIDVADHIRSVGGKDETYTHGGDWKDNNSTISPELARYIMSDPSRSEGVKRFFTENRNNSPKSVSVREIQEFMNR